MDRYKVWYWINYRPAERLREQENDALRKEAAASRKHSRDEQHFIKQLWGWLMSIRATLQPSGKALVEPSDQHDSATYPAEPEYPVIDWKAPEQAGET